MTPRVSPGRRNRKPAVAWKSGADSEHPNDYGSGAGTRDSPSLFAVLRRRAWIIVAVALLTGAAAGAYALPEPGHLRVDGQAALHPERRARSSTALRFQYPAPDADNLAANNIEVVGSRRVAAATARDLRRRGVDISADDVRERRGRHRREGQRGRPDRGHGRLGAGSRAARAGLRPAGVANRRGRQRRARPAGARQRQRAARPSCPPSRLPVPQPGRLKRRAGEAAGARRLGRRRAADHPARLRALRARAATRCRPPSWASSSGSCWAWRSRCCATRRTAACGEPRRCRTRSRRRCSPPCRGTARSRSTPASTTSRPGGRGVPDAAGQPPLPPGRAGADRAGHLLAQPRGQDHGVPGTWRPPPRRAAWRSPWWRPTCAGRRWPSATT